MSVYLVLDFRVLKAELRCVTTTSGGLCVIICGTLMKQLLCARRLVITVSGFVILHIVIDEGIL